MHHVLKGRGNAYLVSAGDHHLLVDTGMKSSFRRLGQTINGLLPKNKTLDFLVLTHTHYDHCQSATKIQEKENCRVVLGQAESAYAQKGYAPLPRRTSLMPRLLTGIGNLMGRGAFGYAAFGIFRNTIFPPFADNTRRLIQSWKKLLDTPCHTFLPGHGGPITRKMLEKEYRHRSKR